MSLALAPENLDPTSIDHPPNMKYLEANLGSRLLIAPIRSIYLERQTGILDIFGPQLKKRLYFVSGELHLRRSELPATERISTYLEQHDRAKQEADRVPQDKNNGEEVVSFDNGFHILTKMIAEHWMVWNTTSFRFTEGTGASTSELVGPLPTASLLVEAAAAASLEKLILQELGGMEATVIAVPDRWVQGNAELWGPEDGFLMDLCQEPVSLGEMLERAGGPPPATLKALSRLWAVGLIRLKSETELSRKSVQIPHPPPKPEESAIQSGFHPQTREIWQKHFRLSGDPFSLSPDPAFLYLSQGHTEALAALKVAVLERRGLAVLIGEVGTGKTTLLYSLLSGMDSEVETAYVANTTLSFDEILRAALKDFGVGVVGHKRVDLLEALNQYLLECSTAGKTVVMVVDEAQALSAEAFEGLRQLLNFESYDQKLLQIFLVGQPELGSRLRERNLRQVTDRIAVRCHLGPLESTEARSYIHYRLEAAGASSRVFERSALALVVRKSRCIPRSINVLCHNAMLFAFARGLTTVDRSLVREAVRERMGGGEDRVSFGQAFILRALGVVALIAALGLIWWALPTQPGSPSVAAEQIEAPTQSANESRSQLVSAEEGARAAPGPRLEVSESLPERRWKTAVNLNVRSGPSLDTAVLVTLPKGTEVELLLSEGDWSVIRFESHSGWAKASFLEGVSETTAEESPGE